VLVFLTRGDEILLLLGAPDKKLWAGKYNGLGGHIEPGETPYQAAIREVQEEAGLTVEALTLRAIVHATLPEPPGVIFFVFVGEALAGELHASAEGTPEWISQSALDTLPLVDDLPQLLPRVLSSTSMTFAHYTFTADGLHITFA
jgi:8-oxo-dGTP diphosphatase